MTTNDKASARSGVVDRALVETWLKVTEEGKRLTSEEGEEFIAVAVGHNLDPFKRELHARIQYENGVRKIMLITGFEVYLKRAAESGLLDGYSTRLEGEGDSLKAVAEIHRKDWSCPFVGEAYFSEVAQKDGQGELLPFWKRSGRYMLRKVCLSQSFRLAFPEVLAGLPYEGSEVPGEKPEASPSVSAQDDAKPSEKPSASAFPKSPDKRVGGPLGSLVEEIKTLVLANQGSLEPQHVSWVIGQLNQPKSERQLKGLLVHVQRSIGEVKAPVSAAKPIRQGVVRRFPTASRNQGNDTGPAHDKAAGAEDMIF